MTPIRDALGLAAVLWLATRWFDTSTVALVLAYFGFGMAGVGLLGSQSDAKWKQEQIDGLKRELGKAWEAIEDQRQRIIALEERVVFGRRDDV